MRHHRLRLGGLALIWGATLFFVFWIFSATESEQSLIEPWPPLQVAFHGAQIFTLVAGLVVTLSLPMVGWSRQVWRIGVMAAIIGTPISLQVFAGGLLLMGIAALFTPALRVAAVPMVLGSTLWIVLFSRGAIIGNEDAPPLGEVDRYLAVIGLGLITVGLVLLGALVRRAGQTGSGSFDPRGPDGLLTTSQSTPPTVTTPATINQVGES
jgi:hypothetical protein